MKKSSARSKTVTVRLIAIFLCFLVAFSLLFFRSYGLVIGQGSEFEVKNDKQVGAQIVYSYPRGEITDRNGRMLAGSVLANAVTVNPKKVKNPYKLARVLSTELGLSYRTVLKKVKKVKRNFVFIERQVDSSRVSKLKALIKKKDPSVAGLAIGRESRRRYPQKRLASQILGFVNVDGRGLSGIEKIYNDNLSGRVERALGLKDTKRNYIMIDADLKNTVTLKNKVELTIDHQIQLSLENALRRVRIERNAKAVSGIVIDPQSGEVLAMASMPDFNPNNFSDFKSTDRRNRIVSDVYEPGSTFKAITYAAAIEEGMVKPSNMIDCENGAYRVGRSTIHDDHPHDVISIRDAFKFSSNIAAGKLVTMMGSERFYGYIKAFGFGEKTKIDLNGEARGLMTNYKRWAKIHQFTYGFGQGVAITPIQLAYAVAAVANGGRLLRPQIVKRIFDSDGVLVFDAKPELVGQVLSEKTSAIMRDVMVSVTEPGGTAPRARIPGYAVAGKTGTAQKVDHKLGGYHPTKRIGSFIGFAPAHDPKVLTLIVVDEPEGVGYGGVVAGPAFKEVTSFALSQLEIAPQFKKKSKAIALPEFKAAKSSQVKDSKLDFNEGQVPHLAGMSARKSVELILKNGYLPKLVGLGHVVEQEPAAGTEYKKGGTVFVRLGGLR